MDTPIWGFEFRVWGLGFMEGSGFGVLSLGYRVEGWGLRVWSLGFGAQGSGLRVEV